MFELTFEIANPIWIRTELIELNKTQPKLLFLQSCLLLQDDTKRILFYRS